MDSLCRAAYCACRFLHSQPYRSPPSEDFSLKEARRGAHLRKVVSSFKCNTSDEVQGQL